jgi:hypothetical protein
VEGRAVLTQNLKDELSVKITDKGFTFKPFIGLALAHLHRKLGITLQAILDLDALFRNDGYRKDIGVKTAVAIVLHKRFQKSKKVSTSNWSREQLTPAQLMYAANDAYAALKVLHALNRSESELPITDRGTEN